MNDLKPCPFCGGQVDLFDNCFDPYDEDWVIHCNNCNMEIRFFPYYHSTEKTIMESWNRRYNNA